MTAYPGRGLAREDLPPMDISTFVAECQAYIFNWHRVTDNAKRLQRQFLELGVETYVINSDERENNNAHPNWIHIGESGYMVQQYAKAVEKFNKTYFIEMMADISDVDASLILRRACHVFSKYDCGVYAPNADYIVWVFDKSRVPRLEADLYEVKNAESLLSVIHKDVLKEVNLDTERYRIGWGIDFLVSLLASVQNKLVVRDYATTIKHPRQTAYDMDEAQQEYERFIEDLGGEMSLLMRQWISDAEGLLEEEYRLILTGPEN